MSETVLIVDDHAGFRRFARLLLEAGGLTVVGEVGDGGSAVETVRELAPDLVVLDVLLPDMDGFVVAEQIAADNPRVRVVLTSLDLALSVPRPGLAGARKRPPEQGECGLPRLAFDCQEDHPYGEA